MFVDESLMRNELFMDSSWANNTLTVRLFDETLGGDKFYDIASSWLNNPSKNKEYLEFIYVCLILGYTGKYSESKDGKERILSLCNNITATLEPLFKDKEQIAFKKVYATNYQESLLQKFQRKYLKIIAILLPLLILLSIFGYAFFDLQLNNQNREQKVKDLVQNFLETSNPPTLP